MITRYTFALVLTLLSLHSPALASRERDDAIRIARASLATIAGPGGAYSYTRTSRTFAHLARPWQTIDRDKPGAFTIFHATNTFDGIYASDSMTPTKRTYRAATYFDGSRYAALDYGDTGLGGATEQERDDFIYESAIYTPRLVLQDFLNRAEFNFVKLTTSPVTIQYKGAHERIVTIAFDAANQVTSITVLQPDDLYGDVRETTSYQEYLGDANARYPSHVVQRSLNITENELHIVRSNPRLDIAQFLTHIPANYRLSTVNERPKDSAVSVWKYDDHLYFLELPHAASRSMLVAFKDYLFIAEAPLTSENGELLIRKAHELFPGKPIHYFAFGHHHNWYLGGVRSFVHEGATILAQPQDRSYLLDIITAPHTMRPDILQRERRNPDMEAYDSTFTVTDGETTVGLYKIGSLSEHTDDYTVFYYPAKKLLFEGDLMAISTKSPLRKANPRQKGLYEGIRKYGLDPQTIVQSWPITSIDREVPFELLEKSVGLTN